VRSLSGGDRSKELAVRRKQAASKPKVTMTQDAMQNELQINCRSAGLNNLMTQRKHEEADQGMVNVLAEREVDGPQVHEFGITGVDF
jgi:hypothetical protein